mmetsp:Transcript_16443/g.33321  ORF Transcript_16443/g.33321 Transcript_16443/m.33321 type:complete len:208 (-) Transcript_16443:319-942(-)
MEGRGGVHAEEGRLDPADGHLFRLVGFGKQLVEAEEAMGQRAEDLETSGYPAPPKADVEIDRVVEEKVHASGHDVRGGEVGQNLVGREDRRHLGVEQPVRLVAEVRLRELPGRARQQRVALVQRPRRRRARPEVQRGIPDEDVVRHRCADRGRGLEPVSPPQLLRLEGPRVLGEAGVVCGDVAHAQGAGVVAAGALARDDHARGREA